MNIALVVVGDGRYVYQAQALGSLHQFLPPNQTVFSYWRVVDDSGGPSPMMFDSEWDVIRHPQRRGLAAAVASAWSNLPGDIDYVFHFEEDFLLALPGGWGDIRDRPLEFDRMVKTLEANPRLAQLVLKRQPWSPEERQAGGIIEMHPHLYEQRDGWVEHRRIFSLNPCLIPREVVDMGWPNGNEAEMTQRLVADGWSFGFWGQRDDPPRVLHIGVERSAGWSL